MSPPPPRAFCDTSFFYACLDAGDANHVRAKRCLERFRVARTALYSTWDVVSETVTLLRYRLTFSAARVFLLDVKPSLRLVVVGEAIREAAGRVFLRYATEHTLSFCDAMSFVVVRTVLDDVPCLAFDRDFRRLGLTVLDP